MTDERLRYRVLTGPDDDKFCARVSAALDEGYELYGGPTLTFDGMNVIVGQAVVLGGSMPTGSVPTGSVPTGSVTA